MVGVNKYVTEEDIPIEVLEIDEELEKLQIEKTNRIKAERDAGRAQECLERLGEACADGRNVMEPLMEAGEGLRDPAGSLRCFPEGFRGVSGSGDLLEDEPEIERAKFESAPSGGQNFDNAECGDSKLDLSQLECLDRVEELNP